MQMHITQKKHKTFFGAPLRMLETCLTQKSSFGY